MDSIPIATSRASDLRKPKQFLLYFQQFPEIVAPEHCVALFQAIIIKHKTFANKFVENPCCPLAEKRSSLAINAVSNADYSIKGIKSLFALDRTIAFLLNY